MSESFQTVLVKDDRLNCKSSINYAVYKGGSNVTYSDVQAISATPNSVVINAIVPSEQTIIDRRVDWSTLLQFRLQYSNTVIGQSVYQYGLTDALSAYPLHSTVTTMSATINNNTVNQNMDDVLQPIIRMLEKENAQKWSSYTPTMPDNFLNYTDCVGSVCNPLGAYNNAVSSNGYHPRGAFQLVDLNLTGYGNGIDYLGHATSTTQTVYVSVQLTEPLMLSPFIFAHLRQNSQGFYGVQNLNFRLLLNPNARLWRTAQAYNAPVVTIDALQNCKFTFCYLTPHPDGAFMSAKNTVGWYEMPRYLTTSIGAIPAGGSILATAQTLQLNQVPDKLIIFARRYGTQTTTKSSDSFIPIKNISINWNNQSGILSTANVQQLWEMSREAGIDQSYLEWTGRANVYNSPSQQAGAQWTPLVGGIVALDFAKHINITESFYAPGSLGTFQLQINVTLINQDPANAVPADQYQLVVITLNSGVMCLERGTCSTYSGILTKQDVLNASAQRPYYHSDVERLVGGAMLDNLKSVVGTALLKEGGSVSGGSVSGGSVSGGSVSGGARQAKLSSRLI